MSNNTQPGPRTATSLLRSLVTKVVEQGTMEVFAIGGCIGCLVMFFWPAPLSDGQILVMFSATLVGWALLTLGVTGAAKRWPRLSRAS